MTRFLRYEIIEVPNIGGFYYDDPATGTSCFRRICSVYLCNPVGVRSAPAPATSAYSGLAGRRPPLPPMGGGTSICVLRCPGTFRVAGAVLLAPPGGGVGTGTANAAAGRAADQK